MRSVAAILSMILTAGIVCSADTKKDDPSQIGNRDVGKGVNFYSIEKEMALGKQLAREVERQAKVLDDPLISEYVNRVGQNLVRNSDAKVPFTFKVIDGPEVNAFALPGGYVFVYTGLIKMADEEDEFAAALAHEIAHVAARHMTRKATKGQLAQIGMVPLSIGLGGWGGYAARQAAGSAILPMTFLSFGRKDEAEADHLGVEYLYAAGYDPNGAISIFEKLEMLEKAKPGVVSRMFATHPMDAERIAKTQEEIQKILPARSDYVVTTSEYAHIRQRLMDQENRRKGDSNSDRPTLKVIE
ncbi:MAG TPA: M48 family metallopeptidase [Bryobacteraceae bacterium]|jgi:predicted Zn-dependent protease|nr:M48 family metallopeptidase [Bryobacteraceae bacterium]